MLVIETQKLTKNYGKSRGITDVNLQVEEGEIFGFLGPNGAGKTTTVRLLLDFIRPNSGKILIFGLDSQKNYVQIKKRIGYLPGELEMYESMNGKEFLNFFISLRDGVDRNYVQFLTERFGTDLAKPIKTLSHGNRQKIGLIQAFMHRPKLIILDEPTAGLDPLMQQEFYKLSLEVKKQGSTIFLSSHILPEVERICDRVAIIREGKIVVTEHVSDLRASAVKKVHIVFSQDIDETGFKNIRNIDNLVITKNEISCTSVGNPTELLRAASKYKIADITIEKADLEEIFLRFYK